MSEVLRGFNLLRHENLGTSSQYWMVYEKFLQFVPAGSQVLDWGCGDGHFTCFCLRNGFQTESFNVNSSDDYNAEGCQIVEDLKSQFPDSFQYRVSEDRDPVSLPYEDASFDVVTSIGVLEHVRQEGGDELKSLEEIRRILKPGGIFFCVHFPNRYSWIEAISRRIPSKHHHPFTFTHKDIRNLNRAAGLHLLELGSYAMLPRNELARLPVSVKNSAWFVKSYNAMDRVLQSVFPVLTQNHYFISKKPPTKTVGDRVF